MRALLAVLLAACGSSPAPTCDAQQLSVTCKNPNGQCVEFTGMSGFDAHTVSANCTILHGAIANGACDTAGREGTCVIPNSTPNSGVTCSPQGHIAIRYFAPYGAAKAQSDCEGVPGATWTPN